MTQTKEEFWKPEDLMSSYSRAQAIEDGMLIDASKLAKEAGFKWPVAVTAGVWSVINNIPERSGQDVTGRLWDVIWMAKLAARRGGTEILYDLILTTPGSNRGPRQSRKTLKMVCGPGDTLDPVITIMLPDED